MSIFMLKIINMIINLTYVVETTRKTISVQTRNPENILTFSMSESYTMQLKNIINKPHTDSAIHVHSFSSCLVS